MCPKSDSAFTCGVECGAMKTLAAIAAFSLVLIAATPTLSQQIDPGFRGFWTLNVDKSDFGSRAKPKTGLVNWGEHGWTFAILTPDGRMYADAVQTDHGCTLIGVFTDFSCEVELVTPRHVRLTMKQGEVVRRVGDIKLLDDGTTQTIHHVTSANGASYVEKTIWEKQVRK